MKFKCAYCGEETKVEQEQKFIREIFLLQRGEMDKLRILYGISKDMGHEHYANRVTNIIIGFTNSLNTMLDYFEFHQIEKFKEKEGGD